MANALVLETLSLKELGALGSSVRLKYWQHLRKGDLLERLAALNRDFTQDDLNAATIALAQKQAARAARVQGVSSPDLSSASSVVTVADVATCAQKIENASQTSGNSASSSSSDDSNVEERVPQTDQSRNSVSSGFATSENRIPSKNKKNCRQVEGSVPCPVQNEVQGESSALSEVRNMRLDKEKIANLAEQVVPILAERLAKRLAERLTQELALENEFDVKKFECSDAKKDEKNETCSRTVALKLVDEIIPSSSDADVTRSESSECKLAREPEQTENEAGVERETSGNQNVSPGETDEEADDDAIIETTLKDVVASRRPVGDSNSGPAPSLKDKLRLKKFIGSPQDKTDRLVLMVCDPYWIRACWEVTEQLVERVRSAMSRHWHTAEPILRLYRIDPVTSRREFIKDVEISGGVSNWYVPVENPPSSFMVELGYKSRDGQFFTLLSSNAVLTPKQFVRESNGRPCMESFNAPFEFQASSHDRWIQKSRQTPAVRRSSFDESPAKPFTPSESAVGTSLSNNESFIAPSSFLFQADAEVVFTGRVSNGATVKVREEPVNQAPDGSFSIRFSLPERRHVFPIVATSLDENETQTIIVALERNTKTLDPVYKEDDE